MSKVPTGSKSTKWTFSRVLILSVIIIGLSICYNYLNHVEISPKKEKNINEKKSKETIKTNKDEMVNERRKKDLFNDKLTMSQKTFLDHLNSEIINDFYPHDCKLKPIKIDEINLFNNLHLFPRLRSISTMDYFRYVKLNLNRKCKLWPDDSKCSLKDCSIRFCDESQLPPSVLQQIKDECSESERLGEVNRTVSSEHIETMNSLFECYEHDQEDGQYFDLLLNPERFTGYKGESSQRIWRSIYEENCFLKHKQKSPFSMDNTCYEERVFYRAISGLHSSINIHLCAEYPLMDGSFTHNKQEFIKRFQGHEDYLKNLYFLFLLELQALHRSEQYLLTRVNWQSSGDQNATREAIKNLLMIIRSFKVCLSEPNLFKQKDFTVATELASHIHNITTNIIDCVGCDKCKLWGKVQIHGLGTALKILIIDNLDDLHLHRHEITTLFNAITRLSNSISNLDHFNRMIKS